MAPAAGKKVAVKQELQIASLSVGLFDSFLSYWIPGIPPGIGLNTCKTY